MPRKTCISVSVCLLSVLLTLEGYAHSPASEEFKFKQPTGEVLHLRVVGNEYYARTETGEGFTVVYDEKTRCYHYAKQDAKSGDLVTTGEVAGKRFPKNLRRHIRATDAARQRIVKRNRQKMMDGEREKIWEERIKKAKKRRALRKKRREANVGDPQSFASG